jgi:hypothetical protein
MPNLKNVKIVDAVDMGKIETIEFYPPKAIGAAKLIYPKEKYAFRFPPMLTWGANDYENDQGVRDGKFKMSLQFPYEATEESDLILSNLKQFQNNLVKIVYNKSKEWFGKQLPLEVVQFTVKPLLVYPKTNGTVDESRAPSYRIKMPKNRNGEWDFEVYNENEDLLYPCAEEEDVVDVVSLIIKETHVPVMWTFNGFVIVNGIVYISVNLTQIVVADAKPSLAGKCLLATKKDSPAKNGGSGSSSGVNATIVYDSDEEVDTKVVATKPLVVTVEEPPNTLEEEDEEKSDNVTEPVEIQPPVVVTAEEPKKKRVAKKG